MATVMAEIGKNAEFVNIGGSGTGAGGNALFDTLSQIPGLMKSLDVSNEALNGKSFNDSISDAVRAVAEPLKGLGVLSTSVINTDEKESLSDVKNPYIEDNVTE